VKYADFIAIFQDKPIASQYLGMNHENQKRNNNVLEAGSLRVYCYAYIQTSQRLV